MSWVLTIILVFLSLYLIYVLAIYLLQARFIFKPTKLPFEYEYEFNYEFEELFLPVEDGVALNCLWFKAADSRGCVLYHHGNAHNLAFWAQEYHFFVESGLDVFFYDYRSYGKSKGKITKESLISDALKMHDFLLQHYPSNKIAQFGRSLGTGIATRVAYHVDSPLLILETPYFNMISMATHKVPLIPHKTLLRFPMRTDHYIQDLHCPIYMFHGTEDELIPYAQGRKLLKLNRKIRLISIKGGMHMNLSTYKIYRRNLKRILDEFPHA